MKTLVSAIVSMFALISAALHAQAVPPIPDRIFAADFTQALAIQGNAGYAGALANAAVEAHFGAVIARTNATADGSFTIAIELDQIPPDAIVELIARGTGAQSQIVWASPLGPASRLLALAGSDNTLTFADEPFVHLNPRTTVAAAAILAYNGNQPVTDLATFHRAARSRQYTTDDLVYALAMIARGSLALPAGAADTYAAITTMGNAQQLYANERIAYQVDPSCGTTPLSPWCQVATTLPVDPGIVPSDTWTDGQIHFPVTAFADVAFSDWAYRPSGGSVDVIGPQATAIAASVSVDADGSYRLVRPDGSAFAAYEDYVIVPPGTEQVHEHVELLTLRLRPSAGAGGQIEIAGASDYHYTYPENPEIPPEDVIGLMSLPALSAGDPLPSDLLPFVPTIANQESVLPSAIPYSGTIVYDTHAFAASTGEAQRLGQTFTFTQTAGSATFSIDFSATHADVEFVNEEEPGVWRVFLHVLGVDSESVLEGLMIGVDPAVAWTNANVPGTYRSRLNGQLCSGPYSDLTDLANDTICAPPFAFAFAADGSVQLYDAPWGTWSLASGADTGRLLFDKTDLSNRRGWQLIRQSDMHYWVLENSDYGNPTPPVTFEPTERLIRYDLQ